MAAQLTGCKFLTTFHGTYSYGPGVLGKLKKYYNSVMTDGDLVIANSNFIAEHLITRYNLSKNKIRVIPRGVDLDKFTSENVSSTRDVELKGLWKLNKDSIIVTLPGRLSRWKGQSLLIEAFSILKDRDDKNNNNLVCLLLGSDQGRSSYRMELEKLIESKNLKDVIKIHGHCDDMAAAYSITDIVISASTRPAGTIGAPVDLPGGFGGLIEFGDQLLAMATDGVGSKLQIASQLGAWHGVGIDCMAMNVNDLLCVGAEPIAFVDYIATPQPDPNVHAALGKAAVGGED